MNALIAGMLSGTELLMVCAVILVLFGGAAIPKFAKNLGKAKGEFEEGMKAGEKKKGDEETDETDKTDEDKAE